MFSWITTVVSVVTVIATAVQAADVVFKNQCGYTINVYDNQGICNVGPGSFQAPTFGCGRGIPWESTMYRHGWDPQATLAEFSYGGGKSWYDISIIPPGSGDCHSWEDCKKYGKHGFNVPMMILPTKHRDAPGFRCNMIMCQYDGCPDAYKYPADPDRTFSCPDDESFQVIFCP